VIKEVLRTVVPIIIKTYIPLSQYCEQNKDMFILILDELLASGFIKDEVTNHFIVETLISFARNEEHYDLLVKWFQQDAISTTTGKKLDTIKFSTKHKHEAMKRIWSSVKMPLSQKRTTDV